MIGGDGSIPSLRLACPDEWPTEMRIRKGHSGRMSGKPEVMPPGWQIAPDERAVGEEIKDKVMLFAAALEAASHGEEQTQTSRKDSP